MMSRNRACQTVAALFLLLLVPLSSVSATEFFLVPLHVYSEDPEVEVTREEADISRAILRTLRDDDTAGLLGFRYVSEDRLAWIPRSTLDAALVSEELQVRYLLYGFVTKTQDYYDAQLRIFDNEAKEDHHVFYARAGRDAFSRVARSLGEQASAYVRDLLGVSPERIEARRRFGGIGIHGSLGYWFPMGDFGDLISGIATAGSGISVIPVTPIYRRGNLSFYLRYGLYLNYSLGINKPEFVDAVLHSLLIRTPIDLSFEYRFNHVAYLGVGPMLRVDFATQQQLYDDVLTETTAIPGVTVRAGYEYWFESERQFALGIQPTVDVAFYEPTFSATTVQLYGIFQLDMAERTPFSAQPASGGGQP